MKAIFIVISLTVASLVYIPHTRADDVAGAAKAFSQAQEAMLSGDIARAAERDRHILRYSTRSGAENKDAVRQINRLLHVVSNKENCSRGLLPDLQ